MPPICPNLTVGPHSFCLSSLLDIHSDDAAELDADAEVDVDVDVDIFIHVDADVDAHADGDADVITRHSLRLSDGVDADVKEKTII